MIWYVLYCSFFEPPFNRLHFTTDATSNCCFHKESC